MSLINEVLTTSWMLQGSTSIVPLSLLIKAEGGVLLSVGVLRINKSLCYLVCWSIGFFWKEWIYEGIYASRSLVIEGRN